MEMIFLATAEPSERPEEDAQHVVPSPRPRMCRLAPALVSVCLCVACVAAMGGGIGPGVGASGGTFRSAQVIGHVGPAPAPAVGPAGKEIAAASSVTASKLDAAAASAEDETAALDPVTIANATFALLNAPWLRFRMAAAYTATLRPIARRIGVEGFTVQVRCAIKDVVTQYFFRIYSTIEYDDHFDRTGASPIASPGSPIGSPIGSLWNVQGYWLLTEPETDPASPKHLFLSAAEKTLKMKAFYELFEETEPGRKVPEEDMKCPYRISAQPVLWISQSVGRVAGAEMLLRNVSSGNATAQHKDICSMMNRDWLAYHSFVRSSLQWWASFGEEAIAGSGADGQLPATPPLPLGGAVGASPPLPLGSTVGATRPLTLGDAVGFFSVGIQPLWRHLDFSFPFFAARGPRPTLEIREGDSLTPRQVLAVLRKFRAGLPKSSAGPQERVSFSFADARPSSMMPKEEKRGSKQALGKHYTTVDSTDTGACGCGSGRSDNYNNTNNDNNNDNNACCNIFSIPDHVAKHFRLYKFAAGAVSDLTCDHPLMETSSHKEMATKLLVEPLLSGSGPRLPVGTEGRSLVVPGGKAYDATMDAFTVLSEVFETVRLLSNHGIPSVFFGMSLRRIFDQEEMLHFADSGSVSADTGREKAEEVRVGSRFLLCSLLVMEKLTGEGLELGSKDFRLHYLTSMTWLAHQEPAFARGAVMREVLGHSSLVQALEGTGLLMMIQRGAAACFLHPSRLMHKIAADMARHRTWYDGSFVASRSG